MLENTAENKSAPPVRAFDDRQLSRAVSVRGNDSQSYAIANAGNRKPRNKISSNAGAARVPNTVISHTSDCVRKKSSIGIDFGVGRNAESP